MGTFDFFYQNGLEFNNEGNKTQLLDDPGYVWMVGKGKVSVFLTAITPDNQLGERRFLFSAEPGKLLFGIKPEGLTQKKGILASGIIGSTLIRLDTNELNKVLNDKRDEVIAEEVKGLIAFWQESLALVITITSDSGGELAAAKELELCNDEEYNIYALKSLAELWETEKLTEKIRLQEKAEYDKRLMSNSIAKLAAINKQAESSIDIEELSGDNLMDACCLIGQFMHIEISNTDKSSNTTLEDIARASFFRTREIALAGQWYLEDNGPILGYLKENDIPIALIPASPNQYILHDFSRGTKSIVTKETAGKIKPMGFVFYRPFANKVITLKELLAFSYQSFWKRDWMMIVLMGVFGGILGTAIPLATGIIFNTVIPEGEKNQLLQIAFFLAASALAAMLFQFTRALATLRIEGKMESSIQAAVWDRLLSLPVPFFKQFSAGELAMRAMGISQARSILTGVTLNAILSGFFSVFSFALLFYYDRELAWTATLLVSISIIFMGALNYRQIRYERKILEISNSIAGMMLQIIGGITKFQVAGAQRRAFYQWANEFVEQRKLSLKKETIGNLQAAFNAVFPALSSAVIFYSLTASTSSLSPGQFIGFNAAFISFMFSVASLSEALINANGIIPLYQRAKPILETLPEYDESKLKPKQLTGDIEVSHVSFRYKEEDPLILKDISLQINEGSYVALVGTSGCGKSTLLRVLLGFEKPETGNVYYNGQDLSKIDIRSVRRQLGVVLQNGQLMSSSIFRNIVGANSRLTIDDAWEAVKMAGMEEDIKSMPMGMHTVISEGAGTISGGQKQCLLIARAIIHKPKIIFFDEATSALDNTTQDMVIKSLDQLKATRIVIAHRLSTIINCNKIIVMDKGTIAETGTFQELMDKNGLFADMARRQLA